MKIIVAIAFLLMTSVASATAPVISCTPSVTSGTAPLGVVLDCTGTTDADTAKPFHDLEYWHTFGDPKAGTWTTGAAANVASKNFAKGPIAAHVYETAGTYTIRSRVSDGTTVVSTTNTITVADPNTTYSGTATVCFANGADFTGCPSGATQTTSSDWDASIVSCRGATKRCLFKRGDTFAAGSDSTITTGGPMTIGAFGSGALPIVNVATAKIGIHISAATAADLRIMDINFVGTGVVDGTGTESAIRQSGFSGTVNGITVLRVTATAMGSNGLLFTGGSGSRNSGSIIQDSTFTGNFTIGVQARMDLGAILGNLIGNVATGAFQALRVDRLQKLVIAHNNIGDAGSGVAVAALRADTHVTTAEDSFYYIASDNYIYQGTRPGILLQSGTTSNDDGRHYDAIFERNYLYMSPGSSGTCDAIRVSAVRTTVRNNLVDLSTCGAGSQKQGVMVYRQNVEPAPDDNQMLNNTFYSSAAAATIRGVRIDSAAVTNSVVKNNLCYFPNGTTCLSDLGTGTVAATNSSDAQTTGTDPSFDTPLTTPSGFRIGTGSYAASGGTAIFPASNSDFFNCDDSTANERLGAFIPRVRARCRSAAGP